ncbi:MAG: hypothetical protein L6R38_001841 [Xanthoria sp. 2 TBL-2021]|nr:MAG: hypothetical protein L6R38_001841 [Xanthoria sp. 2 TBL-2021]
MQLYFRASSPKRSRNWPIRLENSTESALKRLQLAFCQKILELLNVMRFQPKALSKLCIDYLKDDPSPSADGFGDTEPPNTLDARSETLPSHSQTKPQNCGTAMCMLRRAFNSLGFKRDALPDIPSPQDKQRHGEVQKHLKPIMRHTTLIMRPVLPRPLDRIA